MFESRIFPCFFETEKNLITKSVGHCHAVDCPGDSSLLQLPVTYLSTFSKESIKKAPFMDVIKLYFVCRLIR